jgi:hypothetical protein
VNTRQSGGATCSGINGIGELMSAIGTESTCWCRELVWRPLSAAKFNPTDI